MDEQAIRDLEIATAKGNFTGGQIAPEGEVPDGAKMIANAIVYAGLEIAKALRESK